MSTRIARLSKLLRQPKEKLRSWAYPFQRRLPLSWASEGSRRAIMMFDPSTRFGGWVDRVKGIVSTYELAELSKRELHVYAGPTFPLAGLIEPAAFDWRIDRDTLSWAPFATRFHASRDRPVRAFTELRHAKQRDLFVDTNLDYLGLLHPELDSAQHQSLWGSRYRELFRPTRALEEQIAGHVRPDSVAVHARFTNLLDDFKDVVANALTPTAREELLNAALSRVRVIASESEDVIVFSDSPTFLNRVTTIAKNITVLPGTPAHIDHTLDPVETLRKTLLDFYVMQRSRKIVMLRLGPMYDSNFSRYASYVSGIPLTVVT